MTIKLSATVKSFQKRWNVSWDEAAQFDQFKNRLLLIIDKRLAKFIVTNKEVINQYAFLCGFPAPYSVTGTLKITHEDVELRHKGFTHTIIYSTIANSQSTNQIAWLLQNLFTVLIDTGESDNCQSQAELGIFYEELLDVLSLYPASQIRLTKKDKGVIVYPAGAKLLDEALVNENLNWLVEYPESFKAFEQALLFYLSGDKEKYRNLLDNLRVAIEQLLREILRNQKSLENQSKEFNEWLEKQGVHDQIKNLFSTQLFGPYSILQNDAAKHGDKELLPYEYEYLIYLTGTFMRFLIQLNRK